MSPFFVNVALAMSLGAESSMTMSSGNDNDAEDDKDFAIVNRYRIVVRKKYRPTDNSHSLSQ
jgi:hypothetical protein